MRPNSKPAKNNPIVSPFKFSNCKPMDSKPIENYCIQHRIYNSIIQYLCHCMGVVLTVHGSNIDCTFCTVHSTTTPINSSRNLTLHPHIGPLRTHFVRAQMAHTVPLILIGFLVSRAKYDWLKYVDRRDEEPIFCLLLKRPHAISQGYILPGNW